MIGAGFRTTTASGRLLYPLETTYGIPRAPRLAQASWVLCEPSEWSAMTPFSAPRAASAHHLRESFGGRAPKGEDQLTEEHNGNNPHVFMTTREMTSAQRRRNFFSRRRAQLLMYWSERGDCTPDPSPPDYGS
jgi:hypothetical protein